MTVQSDVELLTSAEVAGLYGVPGQTATRWGRSGRLLTTRNPGGGHYRFFASEVRALLRGETREKARELAEADKARLSGGGS